MGPNDASMGIDIGGSAVKVALRTGSGVTTAASEPYARPDRDQLAHAIRDAIARLDPEPLARVRSCGLCVPGRLASDAKSVALSFNVPGLVGYPFDAMVADATGQRLPFVRLTDAEAATIDAASDHPGKRRALGIAIGTGVGAALVESGVPVGIGSGAIGHLGQIDVGPIGDGHTPGSRTGADGGRDSLEAYLGLAAFRQRFGTAPADRLPTLDHDDPAVLALARAIRIALAIYTPDLVLILGGVGLAISPHASALEHRIRDGLSGIAPEGWTLGFGTTRFHAARGAADAAMRHHASIAR